MAERIEMQPSVEKLVQDSGVPEDRTEVVVSALLTALGGENRLQRAIDFLMLREKLKSGDI